MQSSFSDIQSPFMCGLTYIYICLAYMCHLCAVCEPLKPSKTSNRGDVCGFCTGSALLNRPVENWPCTAVLEDDLWENATLHEQEVCQCVRVVVVERAGSSRNIFAWMGLCCVFRITSLF